MVCARGSHKGKAHERSLVKLWVSVSPVGLLPSILWGPLMGKAYIWEEELKEDWEKSRTG